MPVVAQHLLCRRPGVKVHWIQTQLHLSVGVTTAWLMLRHTPYFAVWHKWQVFSETGIKVVVDRRKQTTVAPLPSLSPFQTMVHRNTTPSATVHCSSKSVWYVALMLEAFTRWLTSVGQLSVLTWNCFFCSVFFSWYFLWTLHNWHYLGHVKHVDDDDDDNSKWPIQ